MTQLRIYVLPMITDGFYSVERDVDGLHDPLSASRFTEEMEQAA